MHSYFSRPILNSTQHIGSIRAVVFKWDVLYTNQASCELFIDQLSWSLLVILLFISEVNNVVQTGRLTVRALTFQSINNRNPKVGAMEGGDIFIQDFINDLQESPESQVQKCFRGTCFLITGGTGFVGKVLIEKLLR